MLKYDNGQYIEMTQDEINEHNQLLAELEKNRPQTIEEQILSLQNALITSKSSGGGAQLL